LLREGGWHGANIKLEKEATVESLKITKDQGTSSTTNNEKLIGRGELDRAGSHRKSNETAAPGKTLLSSKREVHTRRNHIGQKGRQRKPLGKNG